MSRLPQTLVLSLSLAGGAAAQDVLMIDKGGAVASMDPATGDVTVIGSTGISGLLWDGMAMDSQGRIFAAYGDWIARYAIYEIDPHTGAASFVVQTNLKGIRGLAFDSGDVLHATDHRDAPLIDSPDDLHSVDLSTGTTTFIGETGSTSLGKVTFADGKLWAYDAGDGLVEIDLQTGAATDVNPLVPALPFTFPDALCATGDGTLYYVSDQVWIMDQVTGAVTRVAPVSLFASWSGAVFRDTPDKPISLWYGGITDGPMTIHLAGATTGGTVALAWTTGLGGSTAIPGGVTCSGTVLDLDSGMQLLGIFSLDSTGRLALGPRFVPAAAAGRIRMQAIDLSTCTTSNVATVWF